jgi:hypothetical protein
MKIRSTAILCVIILILALAATPSQAIPTFQAYIYGGTADSIGSDEETWFSSSNPFTLYVVGAYGPNTTDLENVTLLISVPQGEQGTISFTTFDQSPVLLTAAGTNPSANANIDILTNIPENDGYGQSNFFPTDSNFNLSLNHYPIKDDVSDFLIYDLSSFDDSESGLNDYNAGTGIISSTTATGEQKEYIVSYTGFSRLHFDVYGLVTEEHGQTLDPSWDINAFSHDSTVQVSEPGTILLLVSGLLGLGIFGSRKKNR